MAAGSRLPAEMLRTVAAQMLELARQMEDSSTDTRSELARQRRATLLEFAERKREEGVSFFRADSPTGFNVLRLAKETGLYRIDIRRWLEGQGSPGSATDMTLQEFLGGGWSVHGHTTRQENGVSA